MSVGAISVTPLMSFGLSGSAGSAATRSQSTRSAPWPWARGGSEMKLSASAPMPAIEIALDRLLMMVCRLRAPCAPREEILRHRSQAIKSALLHGTCKRGRIHLTRGQREHDRSQGRGIRHPAPSCGARLESFHQAFGLRKRVVVTDRLRLAGL